MLRVVPRPISEEWTRPGLIRDAGGTRPYPALATKVAPAFRVRRCPAALLGARTCSPFQKAPEHWPVQNLAEMRGPVPDAGKDDFHVVPNIPL